MIDDRNLREPPALDLRLRILERLIGGLLGESCRERLHEAFEASYPHCAWPEDRRLRAEMLHHLEHRFGLHEEKAPPA